MEMIENQATLETTENTSLGAAMAAMLMIGFLFGIGVTLAGKTVNSVGELISKKIKWQKKIK